MDEQKTQRGFSFYEFKDSNRNNCSLQQSSLATLGHIWLGMDKDYEGNAVGRVVDGHRLGARMHLSREEVARLLPLLQHFVATGELGKPEDDDDSKPVRGLVRDMITSAFEYALDELGED